MLDLLALAVGVELFGQRADVGPLRFTERGGKRPFLVVVFHRGAAVERTPRFNFRTVSLNEFSC